MMKNTSSYCEDQVILYLIISFSVTNVFIKEEIRRHTYAQYVEIREKAFKDDFSRPFADFLVFAKQTHTIC